MFGRLAGPVSDGDHSANLYLPSDTSISNRAPSPATTLARPVRVDLLDAHGVSVRMGSRGTLSAPPVTLAFSHRAHREVVWYAGPWPSVERWWVRSRRRAHLQVVLATGEAALLSAESSHWWLVGIYD